jgi:hypothetical protein
MNPATRACVAYVAGRAISASGGSHIYDYSQSRRISIGGSVNGPIVNVYDYDRGCHFSGTLPQLYDYGMSAHVSIEINGTQFKGYDYGAGHHFSGTVNGSSISIYDYGESRHFKYSL